MSTNYLRLDNRGDFPYSPPPTARSSLGNSNPSLWRRMLPSVLPALGVVGSIATRIFAPPSAIVDATTDATFGFCGQWLVCSLTSPENLTTVHRASRCVFNLCNQIVTGSFVWFNVKQYPVPNQLLAGYVVATGSANIALTLDHLRRRGIQTTESLPRTVTKKPVLRDIHWDPLSVNCLKVIGICGVGTTAMLIDDEVFQTILGFLGTYLGTNVVSSALNYWVNQKIHAHNARSGKELSSIQATRWYSVQKGLIVTQLFSMCVLIAPLGQTDAATQVRVILMGIPAGLDEIPGENFYERSTSVPLEDLHELSRLTPDLNHVEPTASCCKKLWRFIWPQGSSITPALCYRTVIRLSMHGFVAWQIGWDLNDPHQKAALGAMLGGFDAWDLSTKWTDQNWNQLNRQRDLADPTYVLTRTDRLKDKMACVFFASPRIFGIDPRYLVCAAFNCLDLDANALTSKESDSHFALAIVIYFLYGAAAARSMLQAAGTRKGGEIDLDPVVITNSIIVMQNMVRKPQDFN